MSKIHVSHISAHLLKLFDRCIDLTDCGNAPEEERAKIFNTRALAAFIPYQFDDLEPKEAGKCVTDGTNDNGIDCVHYNRQQQTLRIIQSKWRSDGHGSIDMGDVLKFIKGVNDILDAKSEAFSEKYAPHWTDLNSAMDDGNTRIEMVFVTTGQDELSEHARRELNDFVRKTNDVSEVITFTHMKLGDLHAIVKRKDRGSPIDVDVQLREWGMTRDPFVSYYGQVVSSDLAQWYKDNQHHLFSPNLRMFLGKTDINLAMMETALYSPEYFWYFNNGVTAICDSIRKKLAGGKNRDVGTFECKNLRVVNGAQTIGSVAAAHEQNGDAVGSSRVLVRIISLERCPKEFAISITKGTNTQNHIQTRDFVALDPEQQRLAEELRLDEVRYAYKSGDALIDLQNGFDLVEATTALACGHENPKFAIQVNKDIEPLWEGRDYLALFNKALSGRKLWRLVQIQRAIDADLVQRSDGELSADEVTVREDGSRVLAHLVFRELGTAKLNEVEVDISSVTRKVPDLTSLMTRIIYVVLKETFPGARLPTVFANHYKCLKVVHEASRRKAELRWLTRKARSPTLAGESEINEVRDAL